MESMNPEESHRMLRRKNHALNVDCVFVGVLPGPRNGGATAGVQSGYKPTTRLGRGSLLHRQPPSSWWMFPGAGHHLQRSWIPLRPLHGHHQRDADADRLFQNSHPRGGSPAVAGDSNTEKIQRWFRRPNRLRIRISQPTYPSMQIIIFFSTFLPKISY